MMVGCKIKNLRNVFLVDANAIAAGVQNWVENTCLTFQEVSDTSLFSSALKFIHGDG